MLWMLVFQAGNDESPLVTSSPSMQGEACERPGIPVTIVANIMHGDDNTEDLACALLNDDFQGSCTISSA